MPVTGFDHYNLRAPRPVLEELKSFYCDVVGLTVGDRPPFRRFGYWLYAADRPVLHLSEADATELRSRTAVTTFAHAAFNCTGLADFERRLTALAAWSRSLPPCSRFRNRGSKRRGNPRKGTCQLHHNMRLMNAVSG